MSQTLPNVSKSELVGADGFKPALAVVYGMEHGAAPLGEPQVLRDLWE